MADFNPIPIPPKGIGPVETTSAGTSKASKPEAGQPDFKDALMKTLGQVGQGSETIADSAHTGIHNVDQAMNAAKHAFENTMQAHQMMQKLIDRTDANPSGTDDRSSGSEDKK